MKILRENSALAFVKSIKSTSFSALIALTSSFIRITKRESILLLRDYVKMEEDRILCRLKLYLVIRIMLLEPPPSTYLLCYTRVP